MIWSCSEQVTDARGGPGTTILLPAQVACTGEKLGVFILDYVMQTWSTALKEKQRVDKVLRGG